ncbi:hypothetical protein EJH27_01845 [Salmonella enterica subsp. enterica serovar Virchow]|nr:hypothetical protein [Salmonella enterica subsp. enterica serovar Virchow]
MENFIHRVKTCHSIAKLELLHSVVNNTVPASKRGEYLELLNTREEFLLKNMESEMLWFEEEKQE